MTADPAAAELVAALRAALATDPTPADVVARVQAAFGACVVAVLSERAAQDAVAEGLRADGIVHVSVDDDPLNNG